MVAERLILAVLLVSAIWAAAAWVLVQRQKMLDTRADRPRKGRCSICQRDGPLTRLMLTSGGIQTDPFDVCPSCLGTVTREADRRGETVSRWEG
jgi:hypothetical protein